VEIPLGEIIQIVCSGEKTEWLFNKGSLPSNSRLFFNSSNSFLTLHNIKLRNEGYYTCFSMKTSTTALEDNAIIRVIGNN